MERPESKKVFYLLDANILIEAHRRYYHFDICPGFWKSLLHHHSQSCVFSIDRVKDEIKKGDDELAEWVKSGVPKSFFYNTQVERTGSVYHELMEWSNASTHYMDGAKNEFASSADAWLIAHAKANNCTIVSQEISNPAKRNRILIPDVCTAFNIKCIDSFQMLKTLQTKFYWNNN